MSEYTVEMDPSSAHPSSSLTAKYVNSQAGTTSATGFRAGYYDDGGAHEYKGIIFGRLPDKDDIHGAGVTDSGLVITGLKVVFTPSTVDVGDQYYTIRELVNQPTQAQGNLVWNGIEYNVDDDGGGADLAATMQWFKADARGDIETSGVISTTVLGWFKPENVEVHTVELDFNAKSFVWGDKFAFVAEREGSSTASDNFFHAGTVALHITYEDPVPGYPVIKLEADTDYRSSIVTMTTKPSEKDIVSFATVWKDGGSDTFENRIGVYYTTASGYGRVIHTGGNPFSTGIFKEADGDIADGFLDTEGETDHLAVWASDMSGTGSAFSAKNRTMSNGVSHSRLSCTGSLSAGTAIGQELTLTVSGFSDAGNSSAAEFVKFGVNWDGNASPANDSMNDYNIVTLDEPATTATVKHTFHKAGDYNVNVCVIDSLGFRSDLTRSDGTDRTIVASNPVAILRSSRDTAVRARYGDEFSVVTLSASHSYPVGSDRILMAHKFKHNANAPVTTYPMDNDNSNFNDVSEVIKLKCNTAARDETELKVFGKISVTSAGANIADSHATFDHYEQTVVTLQPHATAETFGSVSSEYFKSVDFVVVSVLDTADTGGAVYTLADTDGNIINNQIRAAKDTYAWGGYIARASITCAFHTGNKTITCTDGVFLTDGFVPGDTIYVSGSLEDAGNNGLFTISSISANGEVITVNESTLVTGDGSDAAVTIYKVQGPTLPIASYESQQVTHQCVVMSALDEATTSQDIDTGSAVSQTLRFTSEIYNTLDLDTLADAGDIAIQSASFKRSGGISSQMALGNRPYPVGTTRTRQGAPTVSLTARALTQTGYRQLWSLIEGDRYEWTTVDSKKVDVPGTAYKQLRMRLSDGVLNKDPSMASQYTATLNFVVVGELIGTSA